MSDLILAVAVVLMVLLFIIPVPPRLMDVLIVTNLGISVLVLLVALYAPDARRLPSFPTILLLTTLLRLALNVSSTRLILLKADPGEVIKAFGNVVVGSDYIVGGVVFLVLVVVQFVVIAKGAERVAEVAARFTLDAMPGKQMSIDAELRGQLITGGQARDKRADLERESRLYGAMDGAMKFVKGDAIAGVVISIVNIVGGLLIGTLRKGETLQVAAEKYSLLTIGDGLAAQIPSILTSIAAGLIVTRVASAEDAPVSRDIADQFLKQPRAMGLVALLLLTIGVLPFKFPASPFLLLGGIAAVLSAMAFRTTIARAKAESEASSAAGTSSGGAAEAKAAGPPIEEEHLLVLRIGGSPASATLAASDESMIDEAQRIAARVASDLGVAMPPLEVRIADSTLAAQTYCIDLFDAPAGIGAMLPSAVLALTDEGSASAAGLSVLPTAGPHLRRRSVWIGAGQAAAANQAGVQTLSAREAMLWHLDVTLRRNAHRFVGITQMHLLFERLRASDEGAQLVKAVSPSPLPLQAVAEVMQRLVREMVPIRQTRVILESMAKWGQTDKNPQYLTERVRRDLAAVICVRWASGPGRLSVYSLAPEVEDMVRNSVEDTSDGQIVGMAIDERRVLVERVRRAINPDAHAAFDPVLMVENTSIRRALRSILERQLPEVAVLSYDELARDTVLETLGTVAVGDTDKER